MILKALGGGPTPSSETFNARIALAEERKSENTGLQVMNVIKYQKPKTKLEFNFRS